MKAPKGEFGGLTWHLSRAWHRKWNLVVERWNFLLPCVGPGARSNPGFLHFALAGCVRSLRGAVSAVQPFTLELSGTLGFQWWSVWKPQMDDKGFHWESRMLAAAQREREEQPRSRERSDGSSCELLTGGHIFIVWGTSLQPPQLAFTSCPFSSLSPSSWPGMISTVSRYVSLPSSALPPMTLNKVTPAAPTQTFHCITQGTHVLTWNCIIFPLEDLTRCEKSKCDYFQLQMIALVCGTACWCLLGIMVWLKTYCWSYDVSLFH